VVASLAKDWWKSAQSLVGEAAGQVQQSARIAWFRIGDACLEVVSDYQPLLDTLEAHYGDCRLNQLPLGLASIRCTVGYFHDVSLLWLSFQGACVRATIDASLTPFRMLRHLQCDVETLDGVAGWRLFVRAGTSSLTLAAGEDSNLLINLNEAPLEVVTDCIIGVVQSAQPGVLFLHAASVGVAGVGALLIGESHRGKSTMALTFARRGHAFLGDDVAAVRLATREVLAFPKSAGLRDGPLARPLDAQLQGGRHMPVIGADGVLRTMVRVGDLYPVSTSGPLPLRYAFLLDGFAECAAFREFRPGLGNLTTLRAVVSETLPSWGLSPGRDLLRFLIVVNLLSALRCYLVDLGSPDDSAALIEEAMEKTCI